MTISGKTRYKFITSIIHIHTVDSKAVVLIFRPKTGMVNHPIANFGTYRQLMMIVISGIFYTRV